MYKSFRRIIIVLLSIIFIINSSFFVYNSYAEEENLYAQNAVLYCQNTGESIFERNSDEKVQPLSITKLMTCLLAIQNIPLDREIIISEDAASQSGATINLIAGEKVKVKDLIYATLLCSANDAAYAIGEAVSGNMDKFLALMNHTADNIGCENTNFKTPNGLPVKGQFSTADDLLQISKISLTNPIIEHISESESYTLEKTNKHKKREIKNSFNSVRNEVPEISYGKKAYNNSYDCGIIFRYKKNGLILWSVILGTTEEKRMQDVKNIISYADSKIEGKKIVKKDSEQGKVRIKHGAKTTISAYTEEDGYAYLPKQASYSLIETKTVMDDDIEAPVKAGQVLGKFQIFVADDLINEVNLISKEDVNKGWFTSYLGISNKTALIIGLVIIAIVGFFIWITALKIQYNRKKKKIHKQKVMEMALKELEKEEDYKNRGWKF